MVSQAQIFSVEEDSMKRAADQERVMAGGKVCYTCCGRKYSCGHGGTLYMMMLTNNNYYVCVHVGCLHQY